MVSAVGAAVPGWSGTVGNAGDRLGFALAASGVHRDNVTLNSNGDIHTEQDVWDAFLHSY